MFDILFLILISIFVPIIIFVGLKLFNVSDYKKITIAHSISLLALELIKFFVNAALYPKAETPSKDLKFGYITILCIVALFATFNNSKFSDIIKEIFCLTALIPIVLAIFNPTYYVNALDVNGVCKALYMIECGFILSLALLYLFKLKFKINALSLVWGGVFVLSYVGINALTIWYWKIDIAFNLMWYMSHLVSLISIFAIFATILVATHLTKQYKLKNKRMD